MLNKVICYLSSLLYSTGTVKQLFIFKLFRARKLYSHYNWSSYIFFAPANPVDYNVHDDVYFYPSTTLL